MKKNNKACYGLVIPAFNEEASIGSVIDGVSRIIPLNNILIIDDGSNDRTLEIVREKGIAIECHAVRRGKGAALRSGFAWCLQRAFTAVITLDGDGQHDYNDIPKLIHEFEENNTDIVIGSRLHSISKMPLQRIITNKLSSYIVSYLTGQKILDSQSGFRLIKADVLRNVHLSSNSYDMESELLLQAAQQKYKIGYTSINTIYESEKSNFSPFADTLRISKLLLKSFLEKRGIALGV